MSRSTLSPRHQAQTGHPNTSSGWAPTTPTIALGVLAVGQMYTVLALLHPMAQFGFAYAAGYLIAAPSPTGTGHAR